MRSLRSATIGMLLWALCFANRATAQEIYGSRSGGMIQFGTTITVRTNENIDSGSSDGRIFSSAIAQDVLSRNGDIAIPRGSSAELLIRTISDGEVALDLDSVMVNGERYGPVTEENLFGTNQRTGEYAGGGPVFAAIVGVISGSEQGAAIGAGARAGARPGGQVLTRGNRVSVPANSLLTFQLTRPLQAGVVDTGYMQNGVHYHSMDANAIKSASNSGRQKPGYSARISIGTDKKVNWQGPEDACVYVQVDNQAPKLFAEGQSGMRQAPWITQGHVYVFILRDANGNELARDQQDLR